MKTEFACCTGGVVDPDLTFKGFGHVITTGWDLPVEKTLNSWYCEYCGTWIDQNKHMGKCPHCGAARPR